jgi:hypothetical protein
MPEQPRGEGVILAATSLRRNGLLSPSCLHCRPPLSTERCPSAMADEVPRALSTPFSAILIFQFAVEAPDAGGAE